MLGKTNTPEFGTTCFTDPPGYFPARNPWDTERTTGGSSGGAAGALAAGLCPDLAGIGRRRLDPHPVVGVRSVRDQAVPRTRLARTRPPTASSRRTARSRGRLPTLPRSSTPSPGTRRVTHGTAPPPERPFADEVGRPVGKLRVALSQRRRRAICRVAPANARAAARRGEAPREPRSRGRRGDAAAVAAGGRWRTSSITWTVGTCSRRPDAAVREPRTGEPGADRVRPDGRRDPTRHREPTDPEGGARARRASSTTSTSLVTPTVAEPPPIIGSYRDPDNPIAELLNAGALVPFTPPWNTTGQPAVSLPLHHDEQGLPVGVQIVGRPADEATLIRLSAQIEEAAPWIDRRPPVS